MMMVMMVVIVMIVVTEVRGDDENVIAKDRGDGWW